MFARVWAYILQHSAVSASDPLSTIKVKTLVGNDTTTSHTQLKVLLSNHNNHESAHISILLEPRLLGSIPSKMYQATSGVFLRTAFQVSNEKQKRGDDLKQPC